MKIITELDKIRIDEDSVIAIGKFDGVHKGHRALIDQVLSLGKQYNLKTVIFTFVPSPADFFGLTDGYSIMSEQEKIFVLEDMGIDYLVEFPFNTETAGMEPVVFIEDMLCKQLKAKYIVSGSDVSFGKGGKGNYELLQELSDKNGYKTIKIDKIKINGDEISSTLIRKLITKSNIENANTMLGQPFMAKGQVITGNKIGRTIGFPTINVMPDSKKVLPKNGVYYSQVLVDGVLYNSISNIGVKPTIADDNDVLIETYIYDFNADIYGKDVIVYLLEFKRAEQKFSGLAQLTEVLNRDILDGQKYFSGKL